MPQTYILLPTTSLPQTIRRPTYIALPQTSSPPQNPKPILPTTFILTLHALFALPSNLIPAIILFTAPAGSRTPTRILTFAVDVIASVLIFLAVLHNFLHPQHDGYTRARTLSLRYEIAKSLCATWICVSPVAFWDIEGEGKGWRMDLMMGWWVGSVVLVW